MARRRAGSSQASAQSALGTALAGFESSLQDLQALQMHQQHLQQQLHGLARSASASDALTLSGYGSLSQMHHDSPLGNLGVPLVGSASKALSHR